VVWLLADWAVPVALPDALLEGEGELIAFAITPPTTPPTTAQAAHAATSQVPGLRALARDRVDVIRPPMLQMR
jgi:hypothetical protein